MARPISPKLITAMQMIVKGVNPYSAATSVGHPPNRIYVALAKYNGKAETAQEKAKLFLTEHTPQDPLDGIY